MNRALYFSRAALLPGHPVAVLLDSSDTGSLELIDFLHRFEGDGADGLAAIYFDSTVQKYAESKFPDCQTLTPAQIDQLAPYVRNFKCGYGIESGDPFCGDERYTKTACVERHYQYSWHPGMYGRLLQA